MSETSLLHNLLLAFTKAGARLFRNQVGRGWYGAAWRCPSDGKVVTMNSGDVLIRKARPLQAGLCVGSSDLIGWNSVKITPDMVGRTVAIFAAAEGKYGRGKLTPEQAQFLSVVENAGGIAIEARDVEQAIDELTTTRGRA